MVDEIIRVENATFEYDGEPALRGVSMSVRAGEFIVVIGHNGSGKSTLAKLLNALLTPASGKVYVSGLDSALQENIMSIRAQVGMVFQNPDNQIVTSIVEDDVAFGCENIGVAPEDIRRRVTDALDVVGMSAYSEHATHLLSGGQKQRVAIAGALAMQPKCIVLDESTAMLDPRGRSEVLTAIHALNRNLGAAIVLITHHMREAINADRVIVMSDGCIIAAGTPAEIFSNYQLLESAGLSVPDTVKLNRRLELPLDALSVDSCADAILSRTNR